MNLKTTAPAASEWERLTVSVMPLLKGQGKGDQDLPPWELKDSDIDFLAQETGLEREKIRLCALAFAASRDLAVIPSDVGVAEDLSAIFYGWFRQGLPTEPGSLWAAPTETLFTALSNSIEQGVVPTNTGANLGNFRKRIEQIKSDRILQAPALGTSVRLSDLLATLPSPLSSRQKRALAAAMTNLQPDDPILANRIADLSGFDVVRGAQVAQTLQLAVLTGGYLPMMRALQRRIQETEKGGATLSFLVTLRPNEWLDLAYEHGTPDGSTPATYADALAASVERQYPTPSPPKSR